MSTEDINYAAALGGGVFMVLTLGSGLQGDWWEFLLYIVVTVVMVGIYFATREPDRVSPKRDWEKEPETVSCPYCVNGAVWGSDSRLVPCNVCHGQGFVTTTVLAQYQGRTKEKK